MSDLTHDFIQFLIENYDIQLTMSEKDTKKFKEQYPDLAEQMEKKNETATCIGFRPLPDDICAQLSKKYQLYK